MIVDTASRHPGKLLGGDFSQMPYISSFGRLYRLARLNGLRTHQLRQVLKTPSPVLAGLRTGYVAWRELHAWETSVLGGQDDLLPHTWEHWHPYRHRSYSRSPRLRGCRSCLAYGFHTLLHQLPWIVRCQWHDEDLIESCTCGRPFLDASHGLDSRLLTCECGVDNYERSKGLLGMHQWPSAEVRRSLERYLRTTEKSRKLTVLIARKEVEKQAYALFTMGANYDGRPHSKAFATRVIGDAPADRDISNDEVARILRAWWRSHSRGQDASYPILGRCYKRIREYVKREMRPIKDAIFPVGLSGGNVFVNGQLLVMKHIAAEQVEELAASVDGRAMRWVELGAQLLLSIFNPPRDMDYTDHLAITNELTRWAIQNPSSRTLASALSTFTTFCVLDYIHSVIKQAQGTAPRSRFVLDLGEPLALVKLTPKLRISVGYWLPRTDRGRAFHEH